MSEPESRSEETPELTEKKISDLSPFDRRLLVKFVVVEKTESREITSKKTNEVHTLADIKVGDETGTIILTLWDETIDKVSEGQTYQVKNVYVNVFQENMRLALGKWGSLEDTDETIELDSVNLENDRSAEVHQDTRRRRRSYGRRDRDSGDQSRF
ncbi:MAG: single-stranded DNA-binding protein [Candidatus Hodarchaeales archaeon]|jgi:replication factor A1